MSTDKFEYPPSARIPGTNYRVIRRIGAGGMGVVYEVEDVSIEKRYVLKTIQARLAGRDDAVERFIREAKALAKLEHKNIVQVFTAGVTGDAMALRYFVMEKLTGHSLRTVLDNKQHLELEAACRTIIELMGALDKAHEHGIVHRDIKPENIFLHRDSNGVTTLKLLDFGIMTSADSRTVDRKGFVGTVRYAAPEQIQGEDVSALSDLYAATLVLYECIAGRGPFDEVVDFNHLVAAHMTRPPPPLSTFRPGVPRVLEEIVARGLAKNPAERPPDAFTYAAELNRVRRAMQESGLPNPTGVSTVHDLLAQQDPARSLPISTARDPSPRGTGGTAPGPGGPAAIGALADDPRELATRAEGQLAGATTPAPQTPAHAAPPAVGAIGAPYPALGGATVAEAPPTMTLGPEAVPAATPAGPPAGHVQRPGLTPSHRAPSVDRNAPTGTYMPDPARPGSGGDTLHMSIIEQRNLQPFVPGTAQKTARMEPVPEAFGLTTQPPEGLHVTSANTSQSIRDLPGVRSSRRAWIFAAVGVLLAGASIALFFVIRARDVHAEAATRSSIGANEPANAPTAATLGATEPATPSASASAPTSAPSSTIEGASATPSSVGGGVAAPASAEQAAVHVPAATTHHRSAPRAAPHADSDFLEAHRTGTGGAAASAKPAAPRATATAAPLHMPGSGL